MTEVYKCYLAVVSWCQARVNAEMETFFMPLPTDRCIGDIVFLGLTKLPRRVCLWLSCVSVCMSVCMSVCVQNVSESYEWILRIT